MFDFCFINIPIENFFINFEILCHIQGGTEFLKKRRPFFLLEDDYWPTKLLLQSKLIRLLTFANFLWTLYARSFPLGPVQEPRRPDRHLQKHDAEPLYYMLHGGQL